MIAQCPVPPPKWKLCQCQQKTLEKQKPNFSPRALFHTKTRVNPKYPVRHCKPNLKKTIFKSETETVCGTNDHLWLKIHVISRSTVSKNWKTLLLLKVKKAQVAVNRTRKRDNNILINYLGVFDMLVLLHAIFCWVDLVQYCLKVWVSFNMLNYLTFIFIELRRGWKYN